MSGPFPLSLLFLQEVICDHCHKYGGHQKHEVILLQDMDDGIKREMEFSVDQLKVELADLDRFIADDAACALAVRASLRATKDAIGARAAALKAAIQQRADALVATATQEHNERVAALHVRRANLAMSAARASSALEEAQWVLSKDPVGMLNSRVAAEANVAATVRKHPRASSTCSSKDH